MIDFYLRGVKNGNVNCMYGLGFYYQFVTKEYEKMEKYYLMAVKFGDRDSHINYTNKFIKEADNGDVKAMLKLGYYYRFVYVDVEMMLKYYGMAIDKGCVEAMLKLGEFYEKDENKMLMYYGMAVEKGCVDAMLKLGEYFYTKGMYEEMKTFYLMGVEKKDAKCAKCANKLGDYYEEIDNFTQMEYYYLLGNNVKLVRYYILTGKHFKLDRYKFLMYLNKIPLDADGLNELVFYYKFELYDELTPMLRKFICETHEQQVVYIEDTGNKKDIDKINYGYLSNEMATRLYRLSKKYKKVY